MDHHSIETILRRNYVSESTVYHTHVSLIHPEGKFQFSRQTLDDFWKVYCDDIQKGKYNYGIAEKPTQYSPVLADIDLKIDIEKNT
jgi:hypothetical protein